MRGRMFVRLVILIAAVASMLLAPVVTWPSSGRSVDVPTPAPPPIIETVAPATDP